MSGFQRRWADLKLWRLGLGLVMAPLPVTVLLVMSTAAIENPEPVRLLWYARVAFESTIAWSLIVGFGYLLTVTLANKWISRAECLALGAAAALLYPAAVILFRHFAPRLMLDLLAFTPHTDPLSGEVPDWADPLNYAKAALAVAFGLLGGWIFWGFGVRPAPRLRADPAVFE